MNTTAMHYAPHLDAEARRRLDDLTRNLGRDPQKISTIFPATARLIARGPTDLEDPDGIRHPRLEDEARTALLVAVAQAWTTEPDRFASELADLYWYGDADEKRAVLRALSAVHAGKSALPLIDDALRTNDSRLIAAALGDYAGRYLGAEAWRQGVLKCLFVGVPLDAVAQLEQRADDSLARMVADYCQERAAAGRAIPQDAWRILDRFPEVAQAINASTIKEK